MISAITPPIAKNANDVIRYMYPITLWSVEATHDTRMRPLLRRGRAADGAGWETVVVTWRSPGGLR
jgi:hypothetical protein